MNSVFTLFNPGTVKPQPGCAKASSGRCKYCGDVKFRSGILLKGHLFDDCTKCSPAVHTPEINTLAVKACPATCRVCAQRCSAAVGRNFKWLETEGAGRNVLHASSSNALFCVNDVSFAYRLSRESRLQLETTADMKTPSRATIWDIKEDAQASKQNGKSWLNSRSVTLPPGTQQWRRLP